MKGNEMVDMTDKITLEDMIRWLNQETIRANAHAVLDKGTAYDREQWNRNARIAREIAKRLRETE